MGTISTDPIGFSAGDANLYRYAGNGPTYNHDPSGLDDVETSRTWGEYRAGKPQSVLWNNRYVGYLRDDWVYLSNGSRASYTAVNKVAASFEDANGSQIQDALAGIVSPHSINRSSNEIAIFFGGTNQHIHDIGNVEKLYNLFQGTKFYHGGIGHPVDYTQETLSGANGCGFEAGVQRALADIKSQYRSGKEVSIYGWSRGAAQSIELARALDGEGIPVQFLGLFDPVYSVESAGQGSEYVKITEAGFKGNYVSISTPSNVRVATAIYAMNEDRSWFPATRLLPNGTTRLNLVGSPGAHGEVGGHWESNMPIQQLNLRAMIEYARGNGSATFAWRGIDPQIRGILDSKYGEAIALRNYPGDADKLKDWKEARAVELWEPFGASNFIQQLNSTVAGDWNPGGFGTQNWDGVNYVWLLSKTGPAARLFTGPQAAVDHYTRDLPWVEQGLWDIYPGQEAAAPFIQSLYLRKIDPQRGGWK